MAGTGTVLSWAEHTAAWQAYQASNAVYLISIDVGSRNMAIRVEGDYESTTLPAILFDLVDLADDNAPLDAQTAKLSQYFGNNQVIFMRCSWLIVEQQRLIRGQIKNATRNIRLMQHILSYFQLVYPHIARIELPSTLKTSKLMPAPIKMDREARKNWAKEYAMELCQNRGDIASITVLQQAKKKDDLADTVVQLEAYRRWCQGKLLIGEEPIMDTSPRNAYGDKRRAPKRRVK